MGLLVLVWFAVLLVELLCVDDCFCEFNLRIEFDFGIGWLDWLLYSVCVG